MNKEEEYKKTLIDMWDSVRTTNKGGYSCDGVLCGDCKLSLFDGCSSAQDIFDIYRVVNRWGKEHQHQHKEYEISTIEYRILYYAALDFGFGVETFSDYESLMSLLKSGYFRGAKPSDRISDYLENCEVVDDDD